MTSFLQKQYDGFVICSKDNSGLGFAKILADEGANVLLAKQQPEDEDEDETEEKRQENTERFWMAGEGICDQISFDELWKNRAKYKRWAWIWDGNFDPQ